MSLAIILYKQPIIQAYESSFTSRSIKNVRSRHLTIKLFVFVYFILGSSYASNAANFNIWANDVNQITLEKFTAQVALVERTKYN